MKHHHFSHSPRTLRYSSWFSFCLALFVVSILLSGCGVTVYRDNPLLQNVTEKTPTACVYFIRPALIKPKGYADKPVTVTFEGEKLLTIAQGYYTMLQLKPAKGDVITHSLTKFTTQLEPIKVHRKREYNFLAGKTYFIYLDQVNDGFRGIFYDPESISLTAAKKLIDDYDIPARGEARSQPIEKIKEVPDAPPPGPLKPALPEDLYPHYHYLKKKPYLEK